MRRSSGLLLFFGLFLRASAHDRLHCDDSPTYTKDLMSGEIKSPGFPHRYLGFLDCRWTLEPKQDWAIAIDFEFFSTEPQYDYVSIHQTFFVGNQLQGIKQAVLSGDKISPVEFFSSVGGGFEIRFHTDASSHEYPGFRLRFQRFQPADNRFACPLIAHETLGDGHHAKLPPFPSGDSLPRTSCPFRLSVPAGDRGAVNLLVMDVGEGLKVELYQEDYLSPNHYGHMETPFQTLNGISFSSSPKNIAVQQKALYMIVTIVAPNKGTELEIEYFRGPNLCDCGLDEVVVGINKTHSLTSPNYPSPYCNDQRCGTHLKADPALPNPLPNVDRVIQLVFNEFDVEAMHDIFGLYSKGRLLKILTPFEEESSRMLDTFTFDSNDISVNFTTDHSIVSTGYNLTAKVIDRPKICGCPVNTLGPQVNGSYTFNQPANCPMDCFWTILPPREFTPVRISLNIVFVFWSQKEWLEVYRDSGRYNALAVDRLTHSMTSPSFLPTEIIITEGEPVKLWYHQGANAHNTSSSSPSGRLKIQWSWLENCICGAVEVKATDEWQSQSSPAYPSPYCDNLNCTQVMRAEEGSIVQINVTMFSLEHNMDILTFYDGPDSTHPRIDLLTGVGNMENFLESTDNSMTVMFSSDSSVAMEGYTFLYRAKTPERESSSSGWGGVARTTIGLLLLVSLVVGGVVVSRRFDLFPPLTNFDFNTLVPNRSWLPFGGANPNRRGFATWTPTEEPGDEESG